jgi:isopentenyl-diphosphate delta-isomerase
MLVNTSRESHLVELVDPSGAPLGSTTVAQAHTAPGLLHRAFSVLLTDSVGRVLLQQRAATKTRFANAWANTCCGHPAPGVASIPAAVARLRAELGIEAPALHERGTFIYHAHDPASGRVEHEYDHVLIGTLETPITLTLDPTEVANIQWIEAEALGPQLTKKPGYFAPWLLGVLRIAMPTRIGYSSPTCCLNVELGG